RRGAQGHEVRPRLSGHLHRPFVGALPTSGGGAEAAHPDFPGARARAALPDRGPQDDRTTGPLDESLWSGGLVVLWCVVLWSADRKSPQAIACFPEFLHTAGMTP